MPVMPSACTSSSTRRVETPCTYASCTTATNARSARFRGSNRLGKKLLSRTRGTCSSIVPTRVSHSRSRYPLRWPVRVRARSHLSAPRCSATSSSMRVCASTRTPSFRNSASPASALRSNSVSAILSSSAIVASSSRDLDHLDEDHTLAVLVNGPGIYTRPGTLPTPQALRSEEHKSELQSLRQLVFRLLLEKKQRR